MAKIVKSAIPLELNIGLRYVKSCIREIKTIALVKADNESAHLLEDLLCVEALRAIADGFPDPEALARETLKVNSIRYKRWYS
jgi:phosphosulfolactate phosphohydrolase-like enzyme